MKLAQEQNYNKEMIHIHKFLYTKTEYETNKNTVNVVMLRKQQYK